MTEEFTGKVAVITGAGRGMGAEISSRLAQAGASVFAVDLKPASESAPGIVPVQCDVADPRSVRAAAASVLADAGQIDLLVNGAGLVSVTRPVETISDDDWARLMGVNVNGAFHWMRETLPGMKARRSGKIVNVSSRAGRTLANFAGAHYSASKAALLGLTRQVALEAAPDNVHVNAIAPGLVETPMLSGSVDERKREAARAATPLRRIGTTSDIAELVLFLLSPKSDYITGATVDINGGDLIL
ncbi:SDR family NAD(P)-dependent oxidoreductase [Amycolatopsis sp. NPDC004079]|uniref:SDR family NAD(P)-dependent oxidoreductase n=1 Tax=Amycolatopsis sp. NPDC004079 TaxID=3154549 RepID=UPI0033BD20D2